MGSGKSSFPWLKCSGVILILVGLAVLIMGVVVTPAEFPALFNGKLDDYLVVNSNGAEQYSTWAGGADVDNAYYLVYHMYNLTNLPQVLQGGKPDYEVVGPYMYRRYRTSVNVSFPNNGNQIQYSNFYNYIFDSDASGDGLSGSDVFLNINPVYIGGLMQASVTGPISAETNMLLAAVGGLMGEVIQYLTGPFIPLYLNLEFPAYFVPLMNQNIIALNATAQNTQMAYDQFIDIWRNGTAAPSVGNWTGLLLSSVVPSGISADSAKKLLDPTVPYSLLDPSPAAAWMWNQSLTNPASAQNLSDIFQIDLSQVLLIWDWRVNVFAPTCMYSNLQTQFGISQISDIGWVQFINMSPLKSQSFTALFPNLGGYITQVELDDTSSGTTFQQWRQILDPNTGLTNISNYLTFIMYVGQIGVATLMGGGGDFTPWGMTNVTAITVVSYGLNAVGSQLAPTLPIIMGPTAGLFVARTVDQWAYNCDDYLLNLLQEYPPLCSFKYNNSADPLNTIYSGQGDILSINTYGIYENQPQIFGWQQPITPIGHTELGQFPPSYALATSPSPNFTVFQADLMRTVYLNYSSSIQVGGISADRYVLDFEETFTPSSLYFQSTYGLANVSYFHGGSPIFLSLWDMYNVANATNMVDGYNQTNEMEATTIIDIEPITGTTIQCRKRLQVNVWVENNTQWFFGGSQFGNADFTTGIYYPIAKIGEYATISSDQASQLLSKLELGPRVLHITFFTGVTAGPVIFVVGCILVYFGFKRSRGYTQIPN